MRLKLTAKDCLGIALLLLVMNGDLSQEEIDDASVDGYEGLETLLHNKLLIKQNASTVKDMNQPIA